MNYESPVRAQETESARLAQLHSREKAQHFLPRWLRKLIRRSPSLHDKYTYWTQVRRLLSYVQADENFFKTPNTSKDIYDSSDDYEHRGFATGSSLCRVNGQLRRLSQKEVRYLYLNYLWPYLDQLLAEKPKIRVLEMGCGNCINLAETKKRYGDRVELFGRDISLRRIDVAKAYFGSDIDGIDFKTLSATDPVPAEELGAYDLVFSMHCLEQIPFAIEQAVRGVCERAGSLAIMIEPVFEFARPEQKLFLIYSDFVRTLLPTIRYLGYKIVRAEPLAVESSTKNQSSIIVVDKRCPQ